MGIFTTFTGTVTTHKSDNFSVKKALEAYYWGCDFEVSRLQSTRGINTVTQSFVFSIEGDATGATKDFQRFLEQHKKQHKQFEADIKVEGRISC
jgi:hypothetical protein